MKVLLESNCVAKPFSRYDSEMVGICLVLFMHLSSAAILQNVLFIQHTFGFQVPVQEAAAHFANSEGMCLMWKLV